MTPLQGSKGEKEKGPIHLIEGVMVLEKKSLPTVGREAAMIVKGRRKKNGKKRRDYLLDLVRKVAIPSREERRTARDEKARRRS